MLVFVLHAPPACGEQHKPRQAKLSYYPRTSHKVRVRLCSLAGSLGGVETLVSHPATMTHACVPCEDRQGLGITEGLVRISVGIEDASDIIADLGQALGSI